MGDLTLESGAIVPDFRMSYVTCGMLNEERSNAILVLHGLVADHTQLASWAGGDAALDPSQYFMVFPDTLSTVNGDAETTSSPTRTGLCMDFPRCTIRDMVAAEFRLLTEGLGIQHLVAVTGNSMGGVETIQ